MKQLIALIVLACVCISVAGCGGGDDDSPHVVLYVSVDESIARGIIREFEDRTGIVVDVVGDVEEQKTTGLAQRLLAERDNPQADVFWSSEVFHTIRLARAGVFLSHMTETTKDWPAQYCDQEHLWHGFALRARVLVYHPDRVAEDELPDRWMQLTRSWWKGRIAMADPRFGTTGGHLAAMKAYWSDPAVAHPAFYSAFLEGLRDNDVLILTSGNAGVVEAVARGEADIGMTDTDDVWAAQARGLNVKHIYPRHYVNPGRGRGTLLIPNTVARVAGGPNPEQAKQLIEFLLSPDVERMLAESPSHNIPIRPELVDETYAVEDPLELDYGLIADVLEEAIDEAMDMLREHDEADAS